MIIISQILLLVWANKMELYIVMAWGTDDIPIGIFDNLEAAKECAKRYNTSVYTMTLNEELKDKKDFFKKSERNK